MRALAAIAALALIAGCSSTGPTRPTPAALEPLRIRWEAPGQNTDGSPLTDILRYEITVSLPGQAPTRIAESPDTAELLFPVNTTGTWTVQVTAVSASTGAGDTAEQQVAR